MLPETFDALLVPSVLAGILWMFLALALFRFGIEVDEEMKQKILWGMSICAGAVIAAVNTLPPEHFEWLAQLYATLRPFLEFVLQATLGAGVAYVASQASYRAFRALVPKVEAIKG